MDSEVLTLLLTARYVGSPAFNSMAKDIDVLTSKADGLAKLGAGFSLVGTGITALTVGLAVGVGEAIKNASAFQNSMNRVWTVLTDGGKNTADLSARNFSQLEAQIIQTSDTYGQSSNDIAQGTYFIMSALGGMGYKAKDVINNQIIPAFGAFVAASGNGLNGSIDWVNGAKQVVHILGAMHEPIKNWANDLGVLTAAENNASLSQANMVQAMTKLAPSAKLFGLSFKQTVGLVAAESEAGVYGGLAGTEAASAYRLLFTSPASLKALTALGLTRDQLLKSSTLGGVLDPGTMFALLQGKLQKQSDAATRYKLAEQLFGAVGFRAFGPLMQQYAASNLSMAGNPTYYSAIMSKINGSGLGSMLGVSQGMMQSFAAQVARLATNFHNFLTLIGGPLITAITPVIKKLADALQSLNTTLVNMGTKNGGGPGGILGGLSKGLGWLPGAAFGTIGAGALIGPGMTYGGGLLRDWATAQSGKHDLSLERYNKANDAAMLRGSMMQDMLNMRLGFFDQRIAAATKAALSGGGLNAKSLENEMGRLRIQFLEDSGFIRRTSAGAIAKRGKAADPVLQGLLKDYFTAQGPAAGLASRRAWDYINGNWSSIAGAYGFDASKGPVEADVEKMLLGTKGQGALSRIESLKLSRAQAELSGKMQFSNFLAQASQNMPEVAKTPEEMAKSFFKNMGGGILGFGKKFSPVELLKNIAPAIGGAIPAVVGFGSALLPIIAAVLLVAGAVTALVLIFVNFRKQAEEVGRSLLTGLKPVFEFVFGFIQNTLQMVGQAWRDHKQQVDAAILGLLSAIKSVLPSLQVSFAVIGTILGVIVRVVGYLVGAFIGALPGIIAFFSAIFRVFGDFGRIVQDVIHRQWGQAWKDALTLLGNAKDGILSLLGALWSFLTGFFGRLWADIGPTVARFWNNFVSSLPALWQTFQNFWKNLGSFLANFWKNNEPQIATGLSHLWNDVLLPFLQSLPGRISAFGGAVSDALLSLFGVNTSPTIITTKFFHDTLGSSKTIPNANRVGGLAGNSGIDNAYPGGGSSAGARIAGLAANAGIDAVVMGTKKQGPKVKSVLDTIWTNYIQPWLASLPDKLANAWGAFEKAWDKDWAKIQPIVNRALNALWTQELLPFLEQRLPPLLDNALGALWTKVFLPFFGSLPGRILGLLQSLLTSMPQFIMNVGKAMDGTLGWVWSNLLLPFLQSLPGKFTSALNGLAGLMFNLFRSIGQHMADGLKVGAAGLANVPVVGGLLHMATGGGSPNGRHASGGYIPHAMLSWVGETGKELVALPGGSRVFSHQDSMSMVNHALRPTNGGGYRSDSHHLAQLNSQLNSLADAVNALASKHGSRTPAEEYLFARSIQAKREAVWDRYPNTSRDFDDTYRRAYQYYG